MAGPLARERAKKSQKFSDKSLPRRNSEMKDHLSIAKCMYNYSTKMKWV